MTNIDPVSEKVIKLALHLDKIKPNSISEIWIDEELQQNFKNNLPTSNSIHSLISETKKEIDQIENNERKQYLSEIIKSLEFQILDKQTSLSEFTKNCFGYEIKKITQDELSEIESTIQEFENKTGKKRFDIFSENQVEEKNILNLYKKFLDSTKKKVPRFLIDIKDSEFQFELVQNKPWSAFNTHFAPFKSKLSINKDIPMTVHDLRHLAQHEAWGGHHSELSLKDKLLVSGGRGEHGLVIVYSPQVFVSESLAEGMFAILGFKNNLSDEELLLWNYNRYVFALQNLVSFFYFDDKKTKDEIAKKLEDYNIGKKSREVVLNFSTDSVFGRYAAVYYSGYDFMVSLYEETKLKEDLIKHIFTQPSTPSILKDKFL